MIFHEGIKIKRGFIPSLLVLFSVVSLASCGGGHSSSHDISKGVEVELRHAENLKIETHPDFTEVTVRNPWDTLRTLQKYLLVPRDSTLPGHLPEGTVIRTPVTNALIYSTVHSSLIVELGCIDAIGGLCNTRYVNDTGLKSRLASGDIADCGISLSPDLEKILALRPQVIMLSPFENNDKYAKVGELGIPIIECADYMESSPLGRAEWVRFYGMLFGCDEVSEQMFADTEQEYLRLKSIACSSGTRPAVLIDQRYGQVWNVPGGSSTMGQLIEDAGGSNPFDTYPQRGSVALSPEKVLGIAHDADIWFIRYNQDKDKDLAELAKDAPVNSRFRAYRDGNVFACNTRYVDYYEETPFHPDRVLRDMIIFMHPGLLGENADPVYYHKMK